MVKLKAKMGRHSIPDRDLVFLSYADEDEKFVEKIFTELTKRRLNVWFSKKSMRPGRWKPQIKKAIYRTKFFIFCISNNSLNKISNLETSTMLDEELTLSVEIANNQPENEFIIIPVRLEDCDRGDNRLSMWQQYDLFKKFNENIDLLSTRMGGKSLSKIQSEDTFTEEDNLIKALMGKAFLALGKKDNESILSILNSILYINKNHKDALILKSLTLSVLNNNEEAMKIVSDLEDFYPNDSEILNIKGFLLIQKEDVSDSIYAFNRALELNPNNKIAWKNKINLLRLQKNNNEIEQSYTEVLKIFPYDFEILKEFSLFLAYIGKYKKSLITLNKTLSLKKDDIELLLNKGKVLGNLGNIKDAIEIFNQIIKFDPSNHEAWLEKGFALGKQGLIEKELNAYNKAILIKNDYYDAWVNKGTVLEDIKKNDAALEAYETAIKIDSNRYEAWFNKGSLLEKMKNYSEASFAFDKSLLIEPKSFKILKINGRVKLKLNQYNKAIDILKQALELVNDDHEIYLWIGKAYFELDQYKEALSFLLKADISKKDNIYTAKLKAETLFQLRKYKESQKIFTQITKQDPKDFMSWLRIGIINLRMKNNIPSLKAFEIASELDPSNAELLKYKFSLFSSINEIDKAVNVINQLIEIDPKCNETWYRRGIMYDKKGDKIEAKKSFIKAIKLTQNYKDLLRNGLEFCRHGYVEESILTLKKALKINNKDYSAWRYLGDIYFQTNELKRALNCYQKVIRLNGESPEILNNIANIYNINKKYLEAIKYCEKAIEQKENFLEAWFTLGSVYHNMKSYNEGERCFTKVIKINEKDHDAWNRIGIIYYEKSEFKKAIEHFKMAINLKNDCAEYWKNLGEAYKKVGNIKKSKKCLSKSDELIN